MVEGDHVYATSAAKRFGHQTEQTSAGRCYYNKFCVLTSTNVTTEKSRDSEFDLEIATVAQISNSTTSVLNLVQRNDVNKVKYSNIKQKYSNAKQKG